AGARTPGEDAVRRTKDLARRNGLEISGDHRAARRLVEAPGGAGVDLGDLLDNRDKSGRQEFGAAHRARQEEAEKAALDQRRADWLRQFAAALDLGRGGGEVGGEVARPLEVIDG